MLIKDFRDSLIEKAEKLLKKSGISDIKIFCILRFIHQLPNFLVVYILLFSNEKIFLTIIIFQIFVIFFFIIFDGCILTRLELKFIKHFTTPFDFITNKLNMEEKKSGLLLIILTFCIFLIFYYIRFIKNIKITNLVPSKFHTFIYVFVAIILSLFFTIFQSIPPN